MQELKELIASYQTLREGGRGPAICATIVQTARQCNLDKDVQLPGEEDDTKGLSMDERDSIVGKVYSKCAASTHRQHCCLCQYILFGDLVYQGFPGLFGKLTIFLLRA